MKSELCEMRTNLHGANKCATDLFEELTYGLCSGLNSVKESQRVFEETFHLDVAAMCILSINSNTNLLNRQSAKARCSAACVCRYTAYLLKIKPGGDEVSALGSFCRNKE